MEKLILFLQKEIKNKFLEIIALQDTVGLSSDEQEKSQKKISDLLEDIEKFDEIIKTLQEIEEIYG